METRFLQKIDKAIDLFNTKTAADPSHYLRAYQQCEIILNELKQDQSSPFAFMTKLMVLDCKLALGITEINYAKNELQKLLQEQQNLKYISENNSIHDYIHEEVKRLINQVEQLNSSVQRQAEHHWNYAFFVDHALELIDEKADDIYDFDDDPNGESNTLTQTAKKLFTLTSLEDQITILKKAIEELELVKLIYTLSRRSGEDIIKIEASLREKLADAYYDLHEENTESQQKIVCLEAALNNYTNTNQLLHSVGISPTLDQHFSILNAHEKLALIDDAHAQLHVKKIKDYIRENELEKLIVKLRGYDKSEAQDKLNSHFEFCVNYKKHKTVATEQVLNDQPETSNKPTAMVVEDFSPLELNIANTLTQFNEYFAAAEAAVKQALGENDNTATQNQLPNTSSLPRFFAPSAVMQTTTMDMDNKAENHFNHGINLYVKYAADNPRAYLSNLIIAMARVHEKNELNLNKQENHLIQKALLKVAVALNPKNADAKNRLNHLCPAYKDYANQIKPCRTDDVNNYFERQKTKYLNHLKRIFPDNASKVLVKISEELNSPHFLAFVQNNNEMKSAIIDTQRVLQKDEASHRNYKMG